MNKCYDRLSALDAAFLDFEEQNAHWHGALVLVFDAGPLRTADGRLDFDRIINNYEWSFERVPRYRQRLAKTPWLDHPIWIDDPGFDVHYHVRHVALPRPGDDRTFKRVCGYLVALPIDMRSLPGRSGSSMAWRTTGSRSSPRSITAWRTESGPSR